MPKNAGYVSPLLSNLAVDHSKMIRLGLIGSVLFPRVPVGKPSGHYAVFDAETAFKVPSVDMSNERSQATEFAAAGRMQPYATSPKGLKSFIDNADLEFVDGPFKLWEKRKVELLTAKLELAQEKRIADMVLGLVGRSTALAGVGDAKTNKWAGGRGDPYTAILEAINKLFYRPNLMVLSESVYNALEFHPILIAKLGEANMVKKVDEAALAKLFRIDRVLIASGKADFGKRNADKSVVPTGIWGPCLILAYTSEEWDAPCAGKTVSVNYAEADNQGYIVRTWDEDDGGLLGGEFVQVGQDVAELVVCPELVYTVKDVL